ncbi:hypothetical protein B0A48_00243 [Cryoendolithus antarcticus]|uniref:SRP9 domain-containing protein n=1 Tax=Cryoendolithus antarcticus TaxID=1507870 RepID=A0A1V8TUA1_9PEZI|nr:hypothetical protein B0A48_00243 [Cryoendolithus antarcticus]
MVNFDTLEEWQKQTSLLLQARPTTTRISTKYNIPNLEAPRYNAAKKRKRDTEGKDGDAAPAPAVSRATFTLKTFDPVSGVTLKFKTDKSADVGRMVAGLGRAGGIMAALPEKAEGMLYNRLEAQGSGVDHSIAPDVAMEDAAASTGTTLAEASKDTSQAAPTEGKPAAPAAAKKKKKGKK